MLYYGPARLGSSSLFVFCLLLILQRIGINAKEDILEHIGLADVVFVEPLHVFQESVALGFGIMVAIGLPAVAEVVGDVVER